MTAQRASFLLETLPKPGASILPRMHIREASRNDAALLNATYNHYVRDSAATFDVDPWSLADRQRWLDERLAAGERVLAAEDATGVVGFAWSGLYRGKAAYRTSAEVSVYLEPDACGRGVGSRLLTELLSELSRRGRHLALAAVALPHPASRALVLRHGFRSVGVMHEVGYKLGRFWDVEWFERALGPIRRDALNPRPYPG
jgi:phosphinothricin acetyltransferase